MLVLTGTRFGELYKLPPGRVVRVGRGEEGRHPPRRRGRLATALQPGGARPRVGAARPGEPERHVRRRERVQERVLVDGDRVQIGAATTFKVAYADEVEVNYQRRLAEIALRDPLTGVYNRRPSASG